MKKLLLIGAILGIAAAAVAAPVVTGTPAPIGDRYTKSLRLTNSTGRAIDIAAFWVKPVSGTATGALHMAVSQDTDLTGTNATMSAISYAITNWEITAETLIVPAGCRVPIDAVLIFTNTSAATNDVLIYRLNAP